MILELMVLTMEIQELLLDLCTYKTQLIKKCNFGLFFSGHTYLCWHVGLHPEVRGQTSEIITSFYFEGTWNTNMGVGLVGNSVCSQSQHASSSHKVLNHNIPSLSPNLPPCPK